MLRIASSSCHGAGNFIFVDDRSDSKGDLTLGHFDFSLICGFIVFALLNCRCVLCILSCKVDVVVIFVLINLI